MACRACHPLRAQLPRWERCLTVLGKLLVADGAGLSAAQRLQRSEGGRGRVGPRPGAGRLQSRLSQASAVDAAAEAMVWHHHLSVQGAGTGRRSAGTQQSATLHLVAALQHIAGHRIGHGCHLKVVIAVATCEGGKAPFSQRRPHHLASRPPNAACPPQRVAAPRPCTPAPLTDHPHTHPTIIPTQPNAALPSPHTAMQSPYANPHPATKSQSRSPASSPPALGSGGSG